MAKKDSILIGINSVQQSLDTKPESFIEIYVGADNKRIESIVNQANSHKISVQHMDPKKLDKYGTNHQGVVARIRAAKILSEADIPDLVANTDKPLFLILDGVQDPHNFGACLRTADAAGVNAVIIPQDNAVGMTPTVRKVASGAAENVPVVQVANLARVMQKLQELGVWIVGTDGQSEDNLYDLDLKGSIALVMGSEEKGMRQLTKKHCDFLAKLPMHGSVESLNVSVANGICLYEILRQRLS